MGAQVFFPNNMPPTPPNTPRAKRTAKALARAKRATKKVKVDKMKIIKRNKPITDAPTALKKQHKKGFDNKKTRKVKVSRIFKKKVRQVMEPAWEVGRYKAVTCGNGLALDAMSADRQVAFDTINGPWDGGIMFSGDYFIHAISRLWGDNTGITTTALTSTYLKPNVAGRSYASQKFRIIDSYSTIYYKNNSARTLYIKLYVCKPKRKGSYCIDTYNTAQAYNDAGAAVATSDSLNPPAVTWFSALNNAAVTGTVTDGLGGTLSATTLGESPTNIPAFNDTWTTELVSVKLLPAEEYALKVQGPSDVMVEFNKLYHNGIWQNVQKYTRGVLTTVQLDLVATTGGASGRIDPPDTSVTFLSMERHDYIKLSMPNNNVPTGQRKDRYVSLLINSGTTGIPAELVKFAANAVAPN